MRIIEINSKNYKIKLRSIKALTSKMPLEDFKASNKCLKLIVKVIKASASAALIRPKSRKS
jgi:hypothetical protein